MTGTFGWFSIYWEFHHPNWRRHFFREVGIPPTRIISPIINHASWWLLIVNDGFHVGKTIIVILSHYKPILVGGLELFYYLLEYEKLSPLGVPYYPTIYFHIPTTNHLGLSENEKYFVPSTGLIRLFLLVRCPRYIAVIFPWKWCLHHH